MPTLRIDGYKFRFYSSDQLEPQHVHVLRDKNVAKIWLRPVSVQYNRGYRSEELNAILRLTRENQAVLLEAWYGYFSK
ncbi:conserved protein of unknown function [Candidatus Promineifilum breve]|uniref:DUF4160 domain-containing protein n=1 Tax=Candidatus Promineifilum breve TaxID=1806508 RepID=A0A160T464_9CHLR|nr:DUF4160 domain-containing protein [Candidatus Promineifilum breve]CUS03848.2 conserved protein of unknown function [Candidatus Promineifilum breve]